MTSKKRVAQPLRLIANHVILPTGNMEFSFALNRHETHMHRAKQNKPNKMIVAQKL